MITSCLECRRRKLKCDKLHPCTNCSKYARDCMFLAPALDSVSQMKLTEIKEKMGSLERVLEHDVARKAQPKQPKQTDRRKSSLDLPGQTDSSSDEGPVPDDEKDLEPTPLSVVDATYEDDTNDDMLDLGVRIGKMR
jgi:Fungal Zn(2)-Cys(6) binuclear cluster domain